MLEPTLFSEVGYIQVDVTSRLDDNRGALTESLRWLSGGAWVLAERLSYRGIQGNETIRRSRLNPGEFVAEYASLAQQLSEAPGHRLFGGAVSQDLLPDGDPAARELPTGPARSSPWASWW